MLKLPSYSYPKVAYFSMEIGLQASIPTYSGGLGVLAGDTLKAAADQSLPTLAITLLHRKGYIKQHLDEKGQQTESPVVWDPNDLLEPLPARTTVQIEGRPVMIRPWRGYIEGVTGHKVPVYFLDTDLEENSPEDRKLTNSLYGGDNNYRLQQEVILGIGGVQILRAMDFTDIQVFHMNEGHSALLTLALMDEQLVSHGKKAPDEKVIEYVRKHCVFTTHTPVPAGHDKFPLTLVEKVLGKPTVKLLKELECALDDTLNMTNLALFWSRYINGVAMRHGQVSRDMFPNYPVSSITNGVHATTWTTQPFQDLFDEFIPEWRKQNVNLRHAVCIPHERIAQAHRTVKKSLLDLVRTHSGETLKEDVFTIGFARRATAYKRADLFFSDLERLRKIAAKHPIQVIYAGKAHPKDQGGKDLIGRIFEASNELKNDITVVYMENYDMDIASLLCAGVDIWLNTPQKPHEASGTSGMKSALNGVPSLSVLDGWWVEGHIEGVTGWSIGSTVEEEITLEEEVQSLYDKLEHNILPLYYDRPEEFDRVMSSAIAFNGSFFNTQRMILQYLDMAYRQVEEDHYKSSV